MAKKRRPARTPRTALECRDYLLISEIGERLGISYRRALELVRGQIPHFRLSRKNTRVPRIEFERWLAARDKLVRP